MWQSRLRSRLLEGGGLQCSGGGVLEGSREGLQGSG